MQILHFTMETHRDPKDCCMCPLYAFILVCHVFVGANHDKNVIIISSVG